MKAKPKTKKQTAQSLRTLKRLETEALRRKGFLQMCADAGIEHPVCGYKFCQPERQFAFDFAWPILVGSSPDMRSWDRGGVALESDGNGRHTRFAGFRRDQEKTNEAAIRGWLVLRVPSSELCTDSTIALVKRALETRQ